MVTGRQDLAGLRIRDLAVERYDADTVNPAFSIWATGDAERVHEALKSVFPADAIGIAHTGGGFVAGGHQYGEGNARLVVDTSHPDVPSNATELLNLVYESLQSRGADVSLHPNAQTIATAADISVSGGQDVDEPSVQSCGTFGGMPAPCL